MFKFKILTEISGYDSLNEFLKDFKVTNNDLVITNEIIYENTFKKIRDDWNVLFQEMYGYGEPNDQMINKILNDAKSRSFNRVIALGGGTVIDIGKIMALQDADNILDLLYGKIPVKKNKELIVLPTTCGTGSEVTNVTILEDTKAKVKKGIAHQDLFPNHAVLIPALLGSLPYKIFAFSSIDALIHAIESYLAPKSNPITELYSIRAMELILNCYKLIFKVGESAAYDNMRDVLLGSTYAGIAFANTGVGAIHALSYPLGGQYHVPHGESNYVFFNAILETYEKFNPDGKIVELKAILTRILQLKNSDESFKALDELINKVIQRKKLQEYGVKKDDLGKFTKNAMEQERLMNNNYTLLSFNDILEIYELLY